jgi:hypothetical protein
VGQIVPCADAHPVEDPIQRTVTIVEAVERRHGARGRDVRRALERPRRHQA